VRIFEAPVSIDNTPSGTPASTDSSAVATLVEIPLPRGIGRERLLAEFNAAVPEYQKVPGLLRKHFILSQGDSTTGTFGGVYLWRDEASAKAWFNTAWHQRVTQAYGQVAKIEWFDAPILLPSLDVPNTVTPPALRVAAP
jgi:heme-degrading monooxygenase HmoA